MKCVPPFNSASEDLRSTYLHSATAFYAEEAHSTGDEREDENAAAARKWLKATPHESTVRKMRIFVKDNAVHLFTTELIWNGH